MTPKERDGNKPRTLLTALLVASALLLAGCGDDTTNTGADDAATTTTVAAPDLEGTITVSAATSLTDAFTEIGDDFTAANPGVDVRFNFDASSTLATQILDGAPADVYASADEANMAKLSDPGLVTGAPEIFARNELVIVTKPGNPAGIDDLADLSTAGVISLCGEEVPCGKYAKEVLTNAGVTIDESTVTRGQNVGATLAAVTDGDAVAAIVYVTDAENAGDAVEAVAIPEDVNAVATYPIGVVAATAYADISDAFVEWVLGDDGQAVLAEYGFLPPA